MYLSRDFEKIKIYTDGACSNNPGKGGWGFVIIDKNNEIVYKKSGYNNKTTNNRMEIQAIIEAIKYCLGNGIDNIILYSDSEYCINGITKWMNSWIKCNFIKKGQLIKNSDLWMELLHLRKQMIIDFRHVRGHNGNKYNEMADQLATSFRRNKLPFSK